MLVAFQYQIEMKMFQSSIKDNPMLSLVHSSTRVKLLYAALLISLALLSFKNLDVIFPPETLVSAIRTTVKPDKIFHKSSEELQLNTSSDELLFTRAKSKEKENFFIVFVIPTLPKKREIRDHIRKTWANVQSWSLLKEEEAVKKKIRVMFVCGSLSSKNYSAEFREEVSKNDDMFIIKNITEGRNALRYKVMWGMRYSHQHYNFEYLVKTDDDVIVNLPKLISDLSKFPRGYYYLGRCGNNVGKPPQHWHYCSGGGYVLSRDLITEIVNLPEKVHQPIMRPEDVFTGWLVWNVNNNTEHSVRPQSNRALRLFRYRCGLLNKWFYHGYKHVDPEERLDVFRKYFMKNTPLNCSEGL